VTPIVDKSTNLANTTHKSMTIDVSKGWLYISYMNPLPINVAHTCIWWVRLANFGGSKLVSYLFSQYMILGTKNYIIKWDTSFRNLLKLDRNSQIMSFHVTSKHICVRIVENTQRLYMSCIELTLHTTTTISIRFVMFST
jgi:hypothetical protein